MISLEPKRFTPDTWNDVFNVAGAHIPPEYFHLTKAIAGSEQTPIELTDEIVHGFIHKLGAKIELLTTTPAGTAARKVLAPAAVRAIERRVKELEEAIEILGTHYDSRRV